VEVELVEIKESRMEVRKSGVRRRSRV